MVTQSQANTSPGYNMSQSYQDASRYQARGHHMTQPQQMQSQSHSPYSSHTQPQVLGQQHDQPHRMSQSYTAASSSSATHQPPQPTGRKSYKCPRCDKIFSVLQDYRDHIKICLNS